MGPERGGGAGASGSSGAEVMTGVEGTEEGGERKEEDVAEDGLVSEEDEPLVMGKRSG